jgi:2-iminobutanoate/2-iminopropanoate deaminase
VKRALNPHNTPKPIGPYSSVIVANGFVFVAGQGPVDLATGNLIASDAIEDQTRATLTHIRTLLEAAGSSLEKVVQVRVFLKEIGDFAAMNAVYKEFFNHLTPPVRTTIEAPNLYGKRMKIEIECVALL